MNLQMKFFEDVNSIDFSKLRTWDINDYKTKNNLVIINLSVQKVLFSLDCKEKFAKENFTNDEHMIKLKEFIKTGNNIIPVLIIHVFDKKWTILDGKHRFALINYLGIERVPFLIRKSNQKEAVKLK